MQTDRLCKAYRHYHALNGLTMNVPRGSIYGFVGRNGAGKTTLIRLICGLQKPTSGTFTLSGVHSTQKDILNIRRRMGAVVETPSIYLGMSAEDNLKQQYRILGLFSYDGLRELLELVGISDTGRKKAKDFSLGMRQRLGIAIALAGNPDFLILDEPVNGLDPQGIIEIRELIQKLNRERGITVLISSHILDELHRLATWYGFIDQGRIVLLDMLAVNAFTAIYVAVCMISRSKSTSAIVSLLFVFSASLLSLILFQELLQPEYVTDSVSAELVRNPYYIGGIKRTLFAFLNDALPSSQIMQLESGQVIGHTERFVIYDLAIMAFMTVGGIFVFQREDLK